MRIHECLNTLGDSARVGEIGNEVDGDWLGTGVIEKVEAMYSAVNEAHKPAALTLYYENPPTPAMT